MPTCFHSDNYYLSMNYGWPLKFSWSCSYSWIICSPISVQTPLWCPWPFPQLFLWLLGSVCWLLEQLQRVRGKKKRNIQELEKILITIRQKKRNMNKTVKLVLSNHMQLHLIHSLKMMFTVTWWTFKDRAVCRLPVLAVSLEESATCCTASLAVWTENTPWGFRATEPRRKTTASWHDFPFFGISTPQFVTQKRNDSLTSHYLSDMSFYSCSSVPAASVTPFAAEWLVPFRLSKDFLNEAMAPVFIPAASTQPSEPTAAAAAV